MIVDGVVSLGYGVMGVRLVDVGVTVETGHWVIISCFEIFLIFPNFLRS